MTKNEQRREAIRRWLDTHDPKTIRQRICWYGAKECLDHGALKRAEEAIATYL